MTNGTFLLHQRRTAVTARFWRPVFKFNAGKILLYLEGLGGLKYSIPENKLLVPSPTDDWEWMEIRLTQGRMDNDSYEKDKADAGSPLSWERISR